MVEALELLADAARRFDGDGKLVRAALKARPNFDDGAEWMRLALATLRGGVAPSGRARFTALGCTKYAAAAFAAALPLTASIVLATAWPLVLVVPAFYAIEVQAAFVVPLALDGDARPFVASRRMIVESGGTLHAMIVVVPIATAMLFGGLRARGVRRSWSVGCLALLLWYERRRHARRA